MNLNEARQILKKHGYVMLKEYSPFNDTFSHKSEGWDETAERFNKGVEIIKAKINNFGIDFGEENIHEPEPMNDMWIYRVEGKTENGLFVNFSFSETRPENHKNEKNEQYPYTYGIWIRGKKGIDKWFNYSGKEEYDATKVARAALAGLAKVSEINPDMNQPIMDAFESVLHRFENKGYSFNTQWISGSRIGTKVYYHTKYHSTIEVDFEHEGNSWNWKVLGEIARLAKSYGDEIRGTGTIEDFESAFAAIMNTFYNHRLKSTISSKKYAKERNAERKSDEHKKTLKQRRAARVKKFFDEDFIGNFDKCREIDENELNHIIMQRVADNVNDYMFNEYANEDGRVPLWDEDNAWDYFDDDFCGYLDQDYDGDFVKFCDENAITTLDDLNEWLDEWDYDYPSEPSWDPY